MHTRHQSNCRLGVTNADNQSRCHRINAGYWRPWSAYTAKQVSTSEISSQGKRDCWNIGDNNSRCAEDLITTRPTLTIRHMESRPTFMHMNLRYLVACHMGKCYAARHFGIKMVMWLPAQTRRGNVWTLAVLCGRDLSIAFSSNIWPSLSVKYEI